MLCSVERGWESFDKGEWRAYWDSSGPCHRHEHMHCGPLWKCNLRDLCVCVFVCIAPASPFCHDQVKTGSSHDLLNRVRPKKGLPKMLTTELVFSYVWESRNYGACDSFFFFLFFLHICSNTSKCPDASNFLSKFYQNPLRMKVISVLHFLTLLYCQRCGTRHSSPH